ncbi:hypothetical protein OIU80_16395 [Flavobacterium sp. LS1R47]|uniref:Uncharacterized protein n=1 Tax=Flavobacterium frigoritolerans TaxID=2987686 RepID=A0A9X3HMD7_9FLAO|nr:hypothetical protein [Flavobacterium frigoritolerans]MCV9933864.1 hypothetical protein [Flavobacterium frigoritolerans]
MKGLITWDKNIFDGEKRLLPDSNTLYTQIYISEKKEGWSVVFNLKTSARDQGYKTIADEVKFLADEAPHELLKDGFKFDFMDGAKKVGECILFNKKIITINSILDRVELLEMEKQDFKMYINSIKDDSFDYSDEEIKKLIKYSSDYPYLFSLVLKLNKKIALEYLNETYLKYPIKSNVVYHSNLSLFLFNIDKYLGRKDFTKFIEELPKNVNEDEIVKLAIEEILQ